MKATAHQAAQGAADVLDETLLAYYQTILLQAADTVCAADTMSAAVTAAVLLHSLALL